MTNDESPEAVMLPETSLYDPATATIFKGLKDMVSFIGPCDHDVGICNCALISELEIAEAIAKGLMATASQGLPSPQFLEEVRKAVAGLRSLGVPEVTSWGTLVMYRTPAPKDKHEGMEENEDGVPR